MRGVSLNQQTGEGNHGVEAQRAFFHSLSSTLLTMAKDVKLQVQFHPELVSGYRLIFL